MSKKFRKLALLAKIEAVYATDSVPTGAANAIEALDVTITPLNATELKRNLIRPFLGAEPNTLVGLNASIEFSVELSGAGAAGTAPAYGPLVRGCRMAETINAAVSVVYDPVSSGEESVSMYFSMDGILHKLIGSRGNVQIIARANENPMLKFSFIGLFVDPTDAANPTLTLTGWIAPVAVNYANTPTFTLHGFAAVMVSLELDLGNALAHRDLVNSESVKIVDANGSGAVSIEAPSLATKDFFALARAGTLGALQLIHGTVAGNIVQIDAPKVQCGAPGYGESDSVAMLNMGLTITPDVGDDELKITVK